MSQPKKFKGEDKWEDILVERANYWLTEKLEHDCYFIVGPFEGPNERIGAVKAFVTGFSDYFREILRKHPNASKQHQTALVCGLHNVKPGTFKTFLRCAYGLVNSTIEALPLEESLDFLTFVDKYQAYEFKNEVCIHITTFLGKNLEAYFSIISHPTFFSKLGKKLLSQAVLNFTSSNATEILTSEILLKVELEALLFLVGHIQWEVSPMLLWETVVKWAKHKKCTNDVAILRETLKKPIELIQFQQMAYEELCTKVFSTRLLSDQKIASISKMLPARFLCKAVKFRVFEYSFSHTANNVSSLSGRKISEGIFNHLGFWWSISVVKEVNFESPHLGLLLNCEQKKRKYAKRCNVLQLQITLINKCRDHDYNLLDKNRRVMTNLVSEWGWKDFYPWNDLVDTSKGFISDDDKITVRVDFTVDYSFNGSVQNLGKDNFVVMDSC